MRGGPRFFANCSVVVVIALVVVLSAPRRGEAAAADDTHAGDLLKTLNLGGTTADCTAISGGSESGCG